MATFFVIMYLCTWWKKPTDNKSEIHQILLFINNKSFKKFIFIAYGQQKKMSTT